jgi:hypothetical protein
MRMIPEANLAAPIRLNRSPSGHINAALVVGLEQMQSTFKPMAISLAHWRAAQIRDNPAEELIYRAFLGDHAAGSQDGSLGRAGAKGRDVGLILLVMTEW